jgi:LPS sulfotransferase NodH
MAEASNSKDVRMSETPTRKKRQSYDLVTADADYPVWPGSPKRTVIVCTQQRSGSTLLGEAIYFARAFGCPLEYFHSGFRPGFAARWGTTTFRSYLEALYRFRTDPSGTLSIKLFWIDVMRLVQELDAPLFDRIGHVDAPAIHDDAYRDIFRLLSELLPNPVFIFLTRRDCLRQAVSLSIAAQSRTWRWIPGKQSRNPSWKPEYDFSHLIWCVAAIQNNNRHWNNFFHANHIAALTVTYEDLAAGYGEQLRAVLAYLGRRSAPEVAPPRMRKQADFHSERFVERFRQEFFRRTQEGREQKLNEGAQRSSHHPAVTGLPNV